jgi:hypothetical protein
MIYSFTISRKKNYKFHISYFYFFSLKATDDPCHDIQCCLLRGITETFLVTGVLFYSIIDAQVGQGEYKTTSQ